jgi:hypothetical protein
MHRATAEEKARNLTAAPQGQHSRYALVRRPGLSHSNRYGTLLFPEKINQKNIYLFCYLK